MTAPARLIPALDRRTDLGPGADAIADFVDAGLPSTAARPDVVVAEAGASPLEPYNGDVAVRLLGHRVRCTVLRASDPYAVMGVMQAFETRPDLVAGRATSTEAGIALIDKLTGVPAMNVLDRRSDAVLEALLRERLGIAAAATASVV